MEEKTILVTGMGGNVGQGIIRNIQEMKYNIRIIGTNITPFSAGNHLVDTFYQTPYGYDASFVPLIKKIVSDEHVDLIIPSTDYESYYLSLYSNEIECVIAGSSHKVTERYLDKFLTFEFHKENKIPFAESYIPSAYPNKFENFIAKPRKGRGSRGLMINPKDFSLLNDEEYMIQELHKGKEITSAVYRRYNDGEIHGLLTMERSLENGATTFCRVIDEHDTEVMKIAKKMCETQPGLKGSFNIQSIVTDDNMVIPFEINCRISGTNSIRAHFGFKDVQYTIEELLWGKQPQSPVITKGFAYRYLSDVIYPENSGLKGTNQDNFKLF